MAYQGIELSRDDLIRSNFLLYYQLGELNATPAGRSLQRDVFEARKNGYFARPGSVWVRVDKVENLPTGDEIKIGLLTPKNPYVVNERVKGRWKFHLYPTAELGMRVKQKYELLLGENIDGLPYDFMAIDPKQHGMEEFGDRRTVPYPLGPDSKLVLFISELQNEFSQFAATMPDWEDDIQDHISNAEAINQIFRGDSWVVQHIWCRTAMITWNSIFGLYGDVFTR